MPSISCRVRCLAGQFTWLHHTPPVTLYRVHHLLISNASIKTDRPHSEALGASQHDKNNLSQTKIALHRTRLRFLDRINFSVLFFYKLSHRAAPALAASRKSQTEKIEKDFIFFQF